MHTILQYIPYGREHAISRRDLANAIGTTDRVMRQCIQRAREDGILIMNRQDGGGYYLACESDLDDLQRQYAQDSARAMSILRRRKEKFCSKAVTFRYINTKFPRHTMIGRKRRR